MGPKIQDHVAEQHVPSPATDSMKRTPNRLILCFDGTGNSFLGNPGDTNIVKLMDMFDRSAPHQMHYYQPGIGTYTTGGSVNQGFFGRIKKSVTQTIDSAIATSFDAHVIAGYRFLMRYYGTDDRIYILGFSRGAFTARFLSRMISHVGLLSMGNEEMVPFAYKVYQDYEMGVDNEKPTEEELKAGYKKGDNAKAYMERFRQTFCRHGKNEGVKVHFLGLFDTVNSVGSLDVPFTKAPHLPDVIGTAEHVRHAVAIDERRVKFKAALLAQDTEKTDTSEDIKEVWFPGNHGDIGGGWPPENQNPKKPLTFWERVKHAIFKTEPSRKTKYNKEDDWFQLSDIALKWMVDELDNLPNDNPLWDGDNKGSFIRRFTKKRNREGAIRARMHDTMTIGGGSSFGKTLMWKMMEFLPFIKRWEYSTLKRGWEYVTFPLNKGGTRDIPPRAKFHHSVIERMQLFPDTYEPGNQLSDGRVDAMSSPKHPDWQLNDVEYDGKTTGGPCFVPIENQKRKDEEGNEVDVEVIDRVYELSFD